ERRRRVGREVALPAVGNLRRREPDEEHRRGLAWSLRKHHLHLVGQAVALAQVAGRARGDDVLPGRVAAARPRYHVVEREASAGRPAVDAAPAVTGEEGAAGDLALDEAGYADVVHEPDDVRPAEGVAGRAKWSVEL